MDFGDNHMVNLKKFQLNLPYPEIKVEAKNSKYAQLLQDDYAGIVSEFTAIALYSYQHFVSEDLNKEIAEMIKGVSIVEMHHLEMLAEAIIKLGGDPVFRGSYSNKGRYWNGSYVIYDKKLKDILLTDIKAEKEAIKQYNKHIEMIHDPNIQELLKRIVLDEEYHVKLFSEALKKLEGN